MWSGALIYLVVLGMVARGDTQVPEHAILCFLPEVQSVIVNNSCSMRLSACMDCYTASISYSHCASLQVMVLNTVLFNVVADLERNMKMETCKDTG